ncbi:MAG TPA: hypothetical protein VLX85_08270 [Stellaceae bacterium]|nr:hypothetical protein [Stellaceae bacterium]
MHVASHRRHYVGFILSALFAVFLSACATQPSPWSPDVEKLYKEMYHPIIDGG